MTGPLSEAPPPSPRATPAGFGIPAWTAFVVYGFAVVLGYAASGLALYAVAWFQAGRIAPESTAALAGAGATLPGLLAVVGSIALAELLVVLTALRSLRAPLRGALRLGPSHAGAGVLALAVVAMLLLSHVLDTTRHLGGFGDEGTLGLLMQIFENASPFALAVAVLVVGLLAGTAEELLFRGYMQTRLTARWGAPASIAVTSIFFGLAHFDPVQGGAAALLGVYLGAITEWSGSLRPAILCHVVNNILGTLGPALIGTTESVSFHYASLAVAAAGLLFLIPLLRRRLGNVPPGRVSA